MPIYEYQCRSCGHSLDALQKMSEAPLLECPECDEPALKRLLSAPHFRLKGKGWYETDFKSDKERRRNLADGGGEQPAGDKAADASGKDVKEGGKSETGTKTDKPEKPAGAKTEKSAGKKGSTDGGKAA